MGLNKMRTNRAGPFRVLIIDDSVGVLSQARVVLGKTSRLGQAGAFPVETQCVQIVIQEFTDGRGPRPTESCLRELSRAVKPPPDLVLLDYGFATSEIGQMMVEVSRTGKCRAEDVLRIRSGLLTGASLKSSLDGRCGLTADEMSTLRDNFFSGRAPVYLYTFAGPAALQDVIGDVSLRHEPIRNTFPNASVVTIDTHRELYGGSRFEQCRDPGHYPFLVARLLDWVTSAELARFEGRQNGLTKRRRALVTQMIRAAALFVAGVALNWIIDTLFSVSEPQKFAVASILTLVLVVCVGLLLTVLAPARLSQEHQ